MKTFRSLLVLSATLLAASAAVPSLAADGGKVHVVGVYEAGPEHFRLLDSHGKNVDWARLCAELVAQGMQDQPSPGKRLWELLPDQAREIAADDRRVGAMIDDIRDPIAAVRRRDRSAGQDRRALTNALEQALDRSDFYHPAHFAELKPDAETKHLIERRDDLALLERRLLNRRLFEAAFPGSLRWTDFTLDNATVPVRVTVTDEKPITLVLCAHESVRWSIQAEKGKVRRIIVGGYHPQLVTGTEAPVDYYVFEQRDKADRKPLYFDAYKQDDEDYLKLVEAVKELAGKEIATFQGRYSNKGRLFVVDGVSRPVEEEVDDGGVDTIHVSPGTTLNVVHVDKPGSSWDQPPQIVVDGDQAKAPVEFVGLDPIQIPDFWVRDTPMLLFTPAGEDAMDGLKRNVDPAKAKATGKRYVLWRFEAVEAGTARVRMTRRNALGESEGTSEMVIVVKGF